jgi:hypothetical protein
MRLEELVLDPDADIRAVAAFLDGLDDGDRWAQVRRLDRAEQRALYQKASTEAMDLRHLVGGAHPQVEVIHHGINTLPVAAALRRFQKRFCVSPDGRLFGYNEGPLRRLIGPGYFVAKSTVDSSEWRAHGGVVVDYFEVPDTGVVNGWPRVVPNGHGLQRFVYHQTRDFLRVVSGHVSIGAAFKRDRPMDHYFVLCRRGPLPA